MKVVFVSIFWGWLFLVLPVIYNFYGSCTSQNSKKRGLIVIDYSDGLAG